jgi:hypothetical protein
MLAMVMLNIVGISLVYMSHLTKIQVTHYSYNYTTMFSMHVFFFCPDLKLGILVLYTAGIEHKF